MRTWDGLSDSECDVGTGFLNMRNTSFKVDGELRQRPCLGSRLALTATLLTTVDHPIAGASLVGVDGLGNLKGVQLTGGASTTVASSLSTDIRGCFAGSNSRIYYTDDFDLVQRFDRGDAAAVTAGIAAPTVTPTQGTLAAGVVPAGVHRLRYRYKDTVTGYVSNASAELSITSTGAQNIVVNVTASPDAKVNQIILEATGAAGSTFYIAATGTNTTTTITYSMTDAALIVQQATDATYGDFGHELPPAVELLVEHRGRFFGWKTSNRTRTSCTVTNGSATITGTNFPTSGAWNGRLVLINSETTPRLIASTTATTITLSAVYPGAASGSANTIQVYSATPDMLYWSRGLFPEAWQPAVWARRVLNNAGDRPTAIASIGDDLWLFGTRTVKRLQYTSDPAFGMLQSVPGAMGAWNQRCIVNADGRVFGFGPAGVWEIRYNFPTHLSKNADVSTQALMDVSQSESCHGVYDPLERVVVWFFARTGDTTPKDALAYDLDKQEFFFYTYRQPIASSILAGSRSATAAPYLGDSNGFIWRHTPDLLGDGITASMGLTTAVVTTAAGSTTTVLNLNQSMPTAPQDLQGVMLYNPTTGEAIRISSNTATTITLASALATTPTVGAEYYLGSVDIYALSAWWADPTLQAIKRPSYITVEHFSSSGTVIGLVQMFKDYSTSALALTREAVYNPPNGVTFTSGGLTATIDTSIAPVAYVPQVSDWGRAWAWSFQKLRPSGQLRLLDVAYVITSKRDVDAEVKT